MRIYYAHHQWKYGTAIEKYEIGLIQSVFGKDADIINPARFPFLWIETEEDMMRKCLDEVILSDILVFSSMDGVIGKGVYTEIETAADFRRDIYYIDQNSITKGFEITTIKNSTTDRVYATVDAIYIKPSTISDSSSSQTKALKCPICGSEVKTWFQEGANPYSLREFCGCKECYICTWVNYDWHLSGLRNELNAIKKWNALVEKIKNGKDS